MKMVYINEHRELADFAERAARKFAENDGLVTYTDIVIDKAGFLALRWGSANDCVLVVRLDEYFEPVNFQQLVVEVKK